MNGAALPISPRNCGVGLAILVAVIALPGAAALAQSASATPFGAGAGHWALGLATVPFFMRDTILLRLLACLMAALVILLAVVGLAPASLMLVLSMALVVLVNGWRIALAVWETARVAFSEDERALHQAVFSHCSPVDFMRLLKLGEWRSAAPGTAIAIEGRPLDELIVVARGEVTIEKGGVPIARAAHGAFIGEMSYLQGGPASATVRAAVPTRYLAWPRSGLGKLLRRSPSLNLALKTVVSLDLAKKLTKAPSRPPAAPSSELGHQAA